MTELTAHERLHAARQSVIEGRFEEALLEFVWFHEHALAERPSLYGVRLSYALSYWMELAELYPKARVVLEQIRDRKTSTLLSNLEDCDVFHDVASINEYLLCHRQTHSLFAKIASTNPTFAETISGYALPSVVEAGDFELAEKFLPEPERQVRELGTRLNRTIQRFKQSRYSPSPRVKAEIHFYAAKIKRILAVLEGRGKKLEGVKIKLLAIRVIQATSIRSAVAAALEPNARPWYEQGQRK